MAGYLTESEVLEYMRDDSCDLIKFDPDNTALVIRKNVLESRKANILSILRNDHWDVLESTVNQHRDKLKKHHGIDFLTFMLERGLPHCAYILLTRLFVIESALQKFSIEKISNIKYEDVLFVV